MNSFDSLVHEALEKNAELQFYREEIGVMRGQRRQAGFWKNPEMEIEYGKRRAADSADILQGEGFTRGMTLRQPFEFPGKGALRKAVAAKNVELAQAGLEQFKASLDGQVRLLLLKHVAASESLHEAQIIEERGQDVIRHMRSRSLTGPQSLIELSLIESSLMEFQRLSAQFAREKEELRLQINALLGRPDSFPLVIDPAGLPPLNLDRETIVLAALNRNHLLQIRTIEIQKAVSQTAGARLEAMPDFLVGPFYSEDVAGDQEINVGISLSMSLPIWDRNQGKIDAARARERQAEALLLDARRKVEQQVLQSLRDYSFQSDFLGKMPPAKIEELREAADLADRQFRLGTISAALFIEMQEACLKVFLIRQEAEIGAWKSLLDLRLLCGGELPVGKKEAK
ncbi:TolC family protein [Oscillatoria amoena NRMC-F 0135]|nr:TolC family protein [Oscillatoria laete-virens]MDL5046576.1 TolC family protein [Oscillatoria amoena NRMC-F 0135]MDL5053566.1 TolC family protein [Oscillatoria laete-virens NRMC-F 0139]